MARNISKKNTAIFNKKVLELIHEFGGIEGGDLGYTWTVETSIGKLFIKPDDDLGSVYTIFMRFDDEKTAYEYFDCNKFNGKYNIHTFDLDSAIGRFQTALFTAKHCEEQVVV